MLKIIRILICGALAVAGLNAQVPDLILQSTIDTDYITYLQNQEAAFQAQLLPGGDNAQTMRAHMALAVIQAVWVQVNRDTLAENVPPLFFDAMLNAFFGLYTINTTLEPILNAESQAKFFDLLTEFFQSGAYPEFRDEVKAYFRDAEADFDAIGVEIETFKADLRYYGELCGQHWQTVYDGNADFTLNVLLKESLNDEKTFVFTRGFFNHLHDVDRLGTLLSSQFDEGFAYLDSVMEIPGGDVLPGVATLRTGLATFQELTDTLEVILTNQPLSPLQPSLAGLNAARDFAKFGDDLLAGKEFPIGPESEAKTINFLALLQNMPGGGLWTVYEDFYRDGEISGHTFKGIFPKGLPADWLTMIRSDLVLNANDDLLVVKARLAYKKSQWLAMNPMLPDHHMGVALALLVELVTDPVYLGNLQEAFRYLQNGRIDSLTYKFEWADFDLSAEIEEIRYHLEQYINSPSPTNFVILEKYNDEILNRYTITPTSEFSINYITVPQVAGAVGTLSLMAEGVKLVAQAIGGLYRDLSEIFVLDLDPSYLNFSDINNEGELILILEASNPKFLTVTPTGVEKFHQAGRWLEKAFNNIGTFCDRLTMLFEAIAPYEDDFNINCLELAFGSSMLSFVAWSLEVDFATPETPTYLWDEPVNFSAWFDNPPASFLQMWKANYFGYDQRLGGMFPNRPYQAVGPRIPVLPREFALLPVYPNPFNPVTGIEFDLPKSAEVRLTIINLQGQVIATLVADRLPAGHYRQVWDAARQPSGIYLAVLEAANQRFIRKMMLIK